MKLATYNVNGINGRLEALLRWLAEAKADVVCLQELKAPQEKFPRRDIERVGYGAIWHGQKSRNGVAILARDQEPRETRRGLPGDPDDSHSRYIEAAIDGTVVGCLYLPNGNPAPGHKFDYKLRWFERLHAYADELLELVAQGWTDAIRFLHPDERIYTFWKYFRNSFARDAGLRIDHFLLSPPWRIG